MADVSAGDLVQVRPGAIDVTNGVEAKAGWKYVEGHSLWMTVEKVVDNWRSSAAATKKGVPNVVTKVRCLYGSTVVWQVQPQDIVSQVIKASEEVVEEPAPVVTPVPVHDDDDDYTPTDRWGSGSPQSGGSSLSFYAIAKGQENWKGANSPGIQQAPLAGHLGAAYTQTQEKTDVWQQAFMDHTHDTEDFISEEMSPIQILSQATGDGWRNLTPTERASIGPQMKVHDRALQSPSIATSVHSINRTRRKLMLNDIESEIQNERGFPKKIAEALDPFENKDITEMVSAKYDYKINVADPRYSLTGRTLEDQLQRVRASFGIPVHGSNRIARAMKYYLYNRFKSPDPNLAHSRHVTHVFFTRPDLNILKKINTTNLTANAQVMNHTDSALIWRRYPELFKLLTDSDVSGDPDNFNLLLSSQVKSFEILDETLSTNDAGRSWNDHTVTYGGSYTGRTAGEFSCTFDETADFSIINMMKMWITYIDNVSKGVWSPSYNLTRRGDGVASDPTIADSHVFTKTLDYGASVYVIKCDPTGENILYWTKYYGVFPTNTGASALSWDADSGLSPTPKLSIKFAYSWKKDLSPISLLEFNRDAKVAMGSSQIFEPTFDISQNQSGRPIVGTPFVAIKLASPVLNGPGVNYATELTKIRLLFKPATSVDGRLVDSLVYRNDISTRTTELGRVTSRQKTAVSTSQREATDSITRVEEVTV